MKHQNKKVYRVYLNDSEILVVAITLHGAIQVAMRHLRIPKDFPGRVMVEYVRPALAYSGGIPAGLK